MRDVWWKRCTSAEALIGKNINLIFKYSTECTNLYINSASKFYSQKTAIRSIVVGIRYGDC